MLALVGKQVGRNGWAVMVALCRKVYSDGRLGRASAEEIASRSGLTRYQIARGMTELRDKGVIVPVVRKTADGTASSTGRTTATSPSTASRATSGTASS